MIPGCACEVRTDLLLFYKKGNKSVLTLPGFSFDGDEAHCREGYADVEGLLTHLEHVGPLLQFALELSELIRLEVPRTRRRT